MKKVSLLLIAIICFGMTNTFVLAGAWPQKAGHGYYKIGLRVTQADMFFDREGNEMRAPDFTDVTTDFYGEYGLTGRITLVASVPFYKRLSMEREIDSAGGKLTNSGFADIEAGLRVGLLKFGNSVLSAEILFGLPVADVSQPNALGDGEFNQLLKLGFGHSLYPMPAYFSAEIGVNNRTRGYSDELHFSAEIGYTLGNLLLFNFKIRGIRSFENGNEKLGEVVYLTGGSWHIRAASTANNQSYLSYGPQINYLIRDSIGLTVGVDGAAFVQNSIGGSTYSLGIFMR